jgi:hypothetical protein
MDRGGLKSLIFLLPVESAFLLRIISGSFKYLLLPPMLPHSCPPARVTTQSLEGEGDGRRVLRRPELRVPLQRDRNDPLFMSFVSV